MSKLKRNILSIALFVMATVLTIFGIALGTDNTKIVASAATDTTATVQTVEGTQTYQLFNSGKTTSSPSYYYSSKYNYRYGSLTNGGYDLYASYWNNDPKTIQLGLPIQINYDVTEKATLTVYAYDVDEPSEIDHIYLVDQTTGTQKQLGYLHGMNGQWNTTKFEIDPSYFTTGHTYYIKLDVSVNGWVVYVRSVSLQINGKQLDNVITESDFSASISSSGYVTTNLYLKTTESRTYTLEYAASINNNQEGSATSSVTATSSGVTKTVSFQLAVSTKGTYTIDVIVKEANGNIVMTLTATAGYSYYSVNYNANGGSNNLPTDTKSYSNGASVTVLFNYVPSKENYVFQGWSTDRYATTPMYTSTGAKTFYIYGDTTLYAVWAPKHVHVYDTVSKIVCGSYVYYTCECGEGKYDYTDIREHDWKLTSTQDSTCALNGYEDYTCNNCNQTKTVTLPLLDHTWEVAERVDSTCGKDGYTKFSCTVCGGAKYEAISAPGHQWEERDTTPATCTEDGYTVFVCGVCGETKNQVIKALGHNWENEATYVEATCTEDAYVEVTCLVCGVEDTVIDPNTATGHTMNDGEYVVTPDCENPGVIRYTCVTEGCGYNYDEYVKADHSAYLTEVSRQDATCMNDGVVVYQCTACKHSYEEVIEAYGHNYEYADNGDGTHTATCARCKETFTEEHEETRRVCVCGYRNGAYIEILLIQDNQPWTTSSNENVLNNLQKEGYIDAWTMCSTSDILNGKVAFSDYSLVLFANDQTTATYNKYAQFANALATYVEQGGALVFGACDGGWRGGDLTAALPGGMTTGWELDWDNQIKDTENAIVTGENTDNQALVNDDLKSTYCSHVYFQNLPENANVIFENTKGNPTLVEYAYGSGYVIASGLTWEYSVIYCSYADFADIAYDDMIVTALSKVEAYSGERVVVEIVDEEGNLIQAGRVDKEGEVVLPEPPEKEGYEFAGWDIDGDGVADYFDKIPAEIITIDITITIVYEIKFYEVQLNTGTTVGGGTTGGATGGTLVGGTVTGGGSDMEFGSQIVLVATPNAGFVFDGWYVDGVLISIELTFVYTVGAGDVKIEGIFRDVTIVAKVEATPAKPSYSDGEAIDMSYTLQNLTTESNTSGVKSYNINSMTCNGYSIFDITVIVIVKIVVVNLPEDWTYEQTENGILIYSDNGSVLMPDAMQIVIQVSFNINVEVMGLKFPADVSCEMSGSSVDGDGNTRSMEFSSAKFKLNCAHKTTRFENAVASTCTVAGMSGDEYCEDCGELVAESKELVLAEHTYTYYNTVEATCEKNGFVYEICEECECLNRKEMLPALGHEEEFHQSKEMTCKENGMSVGVYCTRCETWLIEQKELVAHPEKVEYIKGEEATCSKEGKTDGEYCHECEAWLVSQETLEKLPHTESEWMTDEDGEYKVCEVCGEELERKTANKNSQITDILAGVGINCSSSIMGVASVPAMVTLLGVGLLLNKKSNRKDDE